LMHGVAPCMCGQVVITDRRDELAPLPVSISVPIDIDPMVLVESVGGSGFAQGARDENNRLSVRVDDVEVRCATGGFVGRHQ
jgi:hypothetical protein